MEYNLQTIRQLAERYFKGETTLAEESLLRKYFSESREVPADLEACRLLFGQCAEAAAERPCREVRLRTEPVRKSISVHGWIAAASGIAAAIMIAVFVSVDFGSRRQDLVCYVNGEQVTDMELAKEYTQSAFDLINENLQKPAEYVSSKTENPRTIERVEEMINLLTKE